MKVLIKNILKALIKQVIYLIVYIVINVFAAIKQESLINHIKKERFIHPLFI